MELALAHAVLRQASRGEVDAVLRVYRPRDNVVVFGRRDTNRPRFDDALTACRAAGFTPVVRAAGGRAVAPTHAARGIDHGSHHPLWPGGRVSSDFTGRGPGARGPAPRPRGRGTSPLLLPAGQRGSGVRRSSLSVRR